DDLWGTVHKDSTFNLPADAKVVFPNLGLLNDALYPYSTLQDLSNTIVVMPNSPSLDDYKALLNTISAIAKTTESDAGIDLIVVTASDATESKMADRNIIMIGNILSNSKIADLKDKLHILFDSSYKELTPYPEDQKAYLAYYNDQGILEQFISNLNPAKIITIMHGKTDKAVSNASTALSEKEKLVKIHDGNFFTVDEKLIQSVVIPEKRKERVTVSAKETSELTSFFWPPHDFWSWVIVIIIGFIILFVISVIFRILGSLFGRKGN
ncbi:MAG: cellulose biosynthesis cyclic di-GMP-binding regulatory protein BcsB, partial [Cyanobacteriota bacterium]